MALNVKKIYYSMGEVAEMLDVNPSLIRYWESKFPIVAPNKNSAGKRVFTEKDIENLKIIYHLVKEKGMTLEGAQKQLKDSRKDVKRDMEIVERLYSIRAMLMEIRQELKDGEQAIDADMILVAEPMSVIAKEENVKSTKEEDDIEDYSDDAVEERVMMSRSDIDEAYLCDEYTPKPRIVEQKLFE